MEINFVNGSNIQTIGNEEEAIRSKRAAEQITYYKKRSDKFVEWLLGHKFPLYQRIWLKLFCSIK